MNLADKNATLEMKLKSDSGFRLQSKGDRISVEQWTAIQHIVAGGDAYEAMRVALGDYLERLA